MLIVGVLLLLFRVVRSFADTAPEVGNSVQWPAATQRVQREQDLSGLAPKCCLVPTEPVKGVAG